MGAAASHFGGPSSSLAAPLGGAWGYTCHFRGFAAWPGGSDEEAAAADAASEAALTGDALQAAADALSE